MNEGISTPAGDAGDHNVSPSFDAPSWKLPLCPGTQGGRNSTFSGRELSMVGITVFIDYRNPFASSRFRYYIIIGISSLISAHVNC